MNEQNVILQSSDYKSIVTINNGELISFKKENEELIHQKGMPGWSNSDNEMFPIIGQTATNNFVVSTPKGNCIQDQHGILRELHYNIEMQNKISCTFIKTYSKNTQIKNSKFPKKSYEEFVAWPYDFSFKKNFYLTNESLNITFEIDTEKGMPFMLGYHPAFKLKGDKTESIKLKNESISIQKIIDKGSEAFPLLNTDELHLVKSKGHSILLKTKGFNNYMLWTEVSNMLCIEPITQYPIKNKSLSKKMFNISSEKECFQITIKPYKTIGIL